MKQLIKNNLTKKMLTVFIALIMLSNFIIPNYVCAKSPGEQLISGVFYLIAYLGDIGVQIMQTMMIGTNEIKNGNEYEIKYSPGLIFSNSIVSLDANFIKPNEEEWTAGKVTTKTKKDTLEYKSWTTSYNTGGSTIEATNVIYHGTTTTYTDANGNLVTGDEGGGGSAEKRDELLEKYGYNTASDKELKGMGALTYTWTSSGIKYQLLWSTTTSRNGVTWSLTVSILEGTSGETEEQPDDYVTKWLNEYGYNKSNSDKITEGETKTETGKQTVTYEWVTSADKRYQLQKITNTPAGSRNPQAKGSIIVTVYEIMIITEVDGARTIGSPANKLQSYVSKWYIALRTIALVGLLSVLLYIGIRIILSSASANDKAKYKNMLKDWIVAICILFTLHYIMAFMLDMTENANNIIRNNVATKSSSEDYEKDILMSDIRNKIGESYKDVKKDMWDVAGYTVMYLALVILTGVFTVQYLKRVIYMAFLTMIAPMIALTYPLDKIKDNKAQAFSFWLREYIFNCLIQPVHFLLYTLLIGNASDFATTNMLYAIVALGFLVPAEKLIKEMFGIKSSTPVGTLGAAAGGAVVMSMLNKMKAKPPKGEDKDGSGSSAPKGVRTATRSSSGNSNADGENGAEAENSGVPTGAVPTGTGSTGTGSTGTGSTGAGAPAVTANATNNSANASNSNEATTNEKEGFKALGKKYIYGPNALKSHLGRFTGIIGGAAGGAIGIAAGIASGNIEDALKYGAAGAATGYQGASNLTKGTIDALKGIPDHIHNVEDTWISGTQGIEAANNRKFDREFYKSDGYKQIVQDKNLLNAFGGKKGIQAATQQFLDNGITDADEIRKAMQQGITGDELKEYSKLGIKAPEEIAKAKVKWGSASYYANLKKIAKFAKGKTQTEFVETVKNLRINDNTLGEDNAKEIYKNIVDLL